MYAFDLSYDPRDPFHALAPLGAPLADVAVAVQVFTTGNVYGLDPNRTMVDADPGQLVVTAGGLSWAGQQRRSPGAATLSVRVDGGAGTVGAASVHITVEATHEEPIKAVKVILRGLPPEALAAGWWQATSHRGARRRPGPLDPLRWRYPWPEDDPWPEWETPWAAAGDLDGPGPLVALSIRDPEVRAKRLFVHRPPWSSGGDLVELLFEEHANHWTGHVVTPPFRVSIAPDRAAVDLDWQAHRAWLEAPYGLRSWASRADVPDWFRDVRLVVNLHGQHWTGYVFSTFDRMIDSLRFVTRHLPGSEVMAYIPGWEGRYYHAYPWYRPADDLGGQEGFLRLVDAAHEMGVHVMPMFGMHGVNAARYPDWERAAFRSRTNRMPVLVNSPDWDGDRSGEDDQVFLNPGEPGFRNHLQVQIGSVVEAFGVDGVFLDTSACWFNDPRYDLVDGYRRLVGALRSRFPGLLVAGEGWYDAMLGIFPVNQSWLGTDRPMVYPDLLAAYARAVGHLSIGAPGLGSTGVHEAGWLPTPSLVGSGVGHIPSIALVGDSVTRFADETAALLDALNA